MTFDEECCREKDIPEKCMVLCTYAGPRYKRDTITKNWHPSHVCANHTAIINDQCIVRKVESPGTLFVIVH